MSRKRRFKRKTLGRLQMFFGKKPYTGHSGAIQIKQYSTHMESIDLTTPSELHYKKCYKKKSILPRQLVLQVLFQSLTIQICD